MLSLPFVVGDNKAFGCSRELFTLNAPDNDVWRVLQIRDPKLTNTENAQQLAFSQNRDLVMVRRNEGGVWGE